MKSPLRTNWLPTLCLLLASGPLQAEESLVLVASQKSLVSDLTSLEIRKLYLGLVVHDREGRQITAITNDSDEKVMDVFLQNVMAMSRRAYDRRLLTLTVQSGRRRPRVIADLPALLETTASDPTIITCMWLKDVRDRDDLKVVKELWRN